MADLPRRCLRGRPLTERLAHYSRETEAGCVEWIGSCNPQGYGHIHIGNRSYRAHRVAWEVATGRSIPRGMVVLHRCDNPRCIKPEHLSIGTTAENVADRDAKGRHCPLPGERNGFAKLTEIQAREILRASGTLREIGDRYNVSLSLVWLIRKGKAWAHL